jgi:hypothetical protein
MPIDKSYLAQHGPSWRVQVAVPKALQPILKAKVLFASTKTDSLALANPRSMPSYIRSKNASGQPRGSLGSRAGGSPIP